MGEFVADSSDKIVKVLHSRFQTVFNSGDNFKRETFWGIIDTRKEQKRARPKGLLYGELPTG